MLYLAWRATVKLQVQHDVIVTYSKLQSTVWRCYFNSKLIKCAHSGKLTLIFNINTAHQWLLIHFPQLVVGAFCYDTTNSFKNTVSKVFTGPQLNMSIIYLPGLIGLLINSNDSLISLPGAETSHPLKFQQTPSSPKPCGIFSCSNMEDSAMSVGARLQHY